MDNSRMNSCGCRQQVSNRRSMDFRQSDSYSMVNKTRENRTMSISEKIDGLPLGMAYVPMQRYEQMFDLTRGLKEGTIFPELCLPFCGKRGKCSC